MNKMELNFNQSIHILILYSKSTNYPKHFSALQNLIIIFFLHLIQSLSPNLLFLDTQRVGLAVFQFWHALIHLICQLYEITVPAVPF